MLAGKILSNFALWRQITLKTEKQKSTRYLPKIWYSYGQEKVIPSQYPNFPGKMVVSRPEEVSVKQ